MQGKNITGFTNTAEAGVGLSHVVLFLVEDELQAKGGNFTKTQDWAVHVITDGPLVTGQNPAFSALAARSVLDSLAQRRG